MEKNHLQAYIFVYLDFDIHDNSTIKGSRYNVRTDAKMLVHNYNQNNKLIKFNASSSMKNIQNQKNQNIRSSWMTVTSWNLTAKFVLVSCIFAKFHLSISKCSLTKIVTSRKFEESLPSFHFILYFFIKLP